MAPVRILGFNHTSFTVRDLDRVIGFFTAGLGFELQSRGPRDPALMARMTGLTGPAVEIAFLVGPGGQRIELIRYTAPTDAKVVRPRFCDVGAAHVGLDVASVDDALTVAAEHGFRLAGAVIAIDAGPNKGRRVCYVQDADGLTVEFLEAPRA
jgi:catechol 2,3-dioxygenase-like lactoylglutathione lyase family enzyme